MDATGTIRIFTTSFLVDGVLWFTCFVCFYRFSYLRTCGCVVSERALKEAPSESCYRVNLICSLLSVCICVHVYKSVCVWVGVCVLGLCISENNATTI